MRNKITSWYKKLHSHFGPQHWWPAETPFEVMVGAILTQNTNWLNVEKAIKNIKNARVLSASKLYALPPKKLSSLIRPAGYYNVKAKRLRSFLEYFLREYKGDCKKMSARETGILRGQLLSVNGIGPETADSILLYALGKPAFVVDAYTKRILSRHTLSKTDDPYDAVQKIFYKHLNPDAALYNEYHALLVKLAKEYCLKNKPKCQICPLS